MARNMKDGKPTRRNLNEKGTETPKKPEITQPHLDLFLLPQG